jgi:AraC family transcriptional regulator of adaptative response/methylated-DNA-[protein]-cysteine methyltransferase
MSMQRISRALLYAAAHYEEQPSLERLAAEAGLSPAHFQRRFQALAGISPKAFVQHLSAQAAGAALRRGRSVLQASLEAGLSGPGRLHDLTVKVEGVTPGQLAQRGEGLTLGVGRVDTPWGRLFAALAPRGIAYAAFSPGPGVPAGLRRLWPQARLRPAAAAVARALAPFWHGGGRVDCWVPGSPFQLQVWRALVRLRPGQRLSYQGLARAAGLSGPRAVGGAVAANPVALLIPCHRVIRASGALGGYHWGPARKRALLAWEAAGALAGR